MLCILCLTASDHIIKIFEEDGIRLNISNVISKHFWLQPGAEDDNKCVICCSCWIALDSFHKFYEKVEEAHVKLTSIKHSNDEVLSENGEFVAHADFLPEDPVTEIKLESCEESKGDLPQVNERLGVIETEKEIKSDLESESDVPLDKLSAFRKSTKSDETGSDSDASDDSYNENDNDSDYNDEKKNNTATKNNTSKQLFGKHRIPCNKFDDFIKQNMKLSCDICQISLVNFFGLKTHFRAAHNEVGYVVCCEKKFDSRHALVHHIFMHKDPETFKCTKCGRVLANLRGLKRHMKTTHVNEERIHQCPKCKKGFRRIELLEKHVKTHVRPEVICEQCGKVVRGRQYLKQHQLREHSGIPKQRQQCPKCGVHLADSSTLHTHMKYQHPIVKVVHECHICGKISASGYGLKRHIEYMHTRGRPHKCTLCEKAFKTLKCLREHMSTHTGEVLYTCPHCPKTFNSNANMHSHRKKMHRKEWEENRRHPHIAAASNPE